MRPLTIWTIVFAAFAAQAVVVHFLPFPAWGKLLVACLYGGLVGWGIVRLKSR
jgi:hypothetical protein